MPALKRKSNSCEKELSCLQATQKSSKMPKNSCSVVRLIHETAELDTSIHNCKNGCEEGITVPEVTADDYDIWTNETSDYQTSCGLDSFIADMGAPIFIDGISGFDDIVNDNLFIESDFGGQNSMLDMSEGCMKLPALEETPEVADTCFAESCEELSKNSDYSWFHVVSHQIKPYDQEHDVNYSPVDIDEADFDPHLFIRNFLDLPDLGPDLLPVSVTKETSGRKRITLVLDLDETLVHSTMEPCDNADFTFQVFFNMKEQTVYVRERPFLRTFLDRVAELFEIVVFTASQSIYAEQLLDILDPERKLIARRMYRESCIFSDGNYTKDLTVIGVDLAKIAIIDNSPQVFRLQVDNGIPIKSWFDDPSDCALISLMPFLETLVDADDVRPIISKKFGSKE